jgi:drug/metabolite transporter (DMT)-like permease
MSSPTLAVNAGRAPALSTLLLLCLAATWLIWGSTYLAIKFALASFPPFFQMGTRFLAAGALLMAWMRWRGAAWPTRRQWHNALVIGTLMLGGGMGGTAVAETSVGSGLVVAFIAVVPLMIAALNLIWGVRPGRLELAGIVVGLAGVLMLTQGAGFQASPAGLAAIAIACLTWSVGSVLSQRSLPLAPGAVLGFDFLLAAGLLGGAQAGQFFLFGLPLGVLGRLLPIQFGLPPGQFLSLRPQAGRFLGLACLPRLPLGQQGFQRQPDLADGLHGVRPAVGERVRVRLERAGLVQRRTDRGGVPVRHVQHAAADRVDLGLQGRFAGRFGAFAFGFFLRLAPFLGFDRRIDGFLDGEQFGVDPFRLVVDQFALRQHGRLDLGAGLFQLAAQVANLGAGRFGGGQPGGGGRVERRGVLRPQMRQRGGSGAVLGDGGRLGGGLILDGRLGHGLGSGRAPSVALAWGERLLALAFAGGFGLAVGFVALVVFGGAGQQPEQAGVIAQLPELGDLPGVPAFARHLELHGVIALAVGAAGALAHGRADGLAEQGFPLEPVLPAQLLEVVERFGLEENRRQHTVGVHEQHRQPRLQGVAEELARADLGADDLHVELGAAHRRGADFELAALAIRPPLANGIGQDLPLRQASLVQGDFEGGV